MCGLRSRLNYPEFVNKLNLFDIFGVVETKLDTHDVISIEGYSFLSQIRKQKFMRRSGGIGVFIKDHLSEKCHLLDTDSDFVL